MYSRYSFEEQMYIYIYNCIIIYVQLFFKAVSTIHSDPHLSTTQMCLADEDQEAGKHRGEQGTHRPFKRRGGAHHSGSWWLSQE